MRSDLAVQFRVIARRARSGCPWCGGQHGPRCRESIQVRLEVLQQILEGGELVAIREWVPTEDGSGLVQTEDFVRGVLRPDFVRGLQHSLERARFFVAYDP